MDQSTLATPVFVTYVIAASLMVLKIMLQGCITVVRMPLGGMSAS
jgi:glutathione S-transferase